MQDAALGAQDSVPAIGGFSLGAKFVGLTAGLILLLSVTAFISLRNSAETVRQFGSVVETAGNATVSSPNSAASASEFR